MTAEIKAISSYTGFNFNEVLELPYSQYMLYKRDSWISGLNQDEKGREFLKTLWRLQQTKPDIDAIHSFNGRKEV